MDSQMVVKALIVARYYFKRRVNELKIGRSPMRDAWDKRRLNKWHHSPNSLKGTIHQNLNEKHFIIGRWGNMLAKFEK